MWRRLALCLLLGAVSAACPGHWGRAQEAREAKSTPPSSENAELPSELQPTIATSVPALAEFKKGLIDLGYNLQFS
jgi:hypothetical protein